MFFFLLNAQFYEGPTPIRVKFRDIPYTVRTFNLSYPTIENPDSINVCCTSINNVDSDRAATLSLDIFYRDVHTKKVRYHTAVG